ncbi:MAG: nickel-dependent hydrogenase large subunit [Bryobacteraceae bacterium]|nr:nickel-dependent hydrogenase large subunit [Bryobacteraceae bacterium]MDW8379770.1 nickel-dependent hydrogenase large subunit [Bryobacterales bacterium]
MKTRRVIHVPVLARVEGEGGLYIRVQGGRVMDVKLNIYEPPRFFEAFLRGRSWQEAPDIVARICGICPIAYQMSCVQAMEQIFGLTVDPMVRLLRRLIYCGEWIESHTLHVGMLHAPDFLGYDDSLAMAKDHPQFVQDVLALKKTGNDLMGLLGGREIHPVSLCVGGFYRAPTRRQLQAMVGPLERARDLALRLLRRVAAFDFPDFNLDYEFVALSHPSEYAITEGRIVSNRGLNIPVTAYEDHFIEQHVAHSNALHSIRRQGGSYLVGPLARFNLNFAQLGEELSKLAQECGVSPPCRNPFRSIIVRMLETLFACEEALRLIACYEPPERPCVDVTPRAGIGTACTEAPRGLIYHRYQVDENGNILAAKIVPPTSQNQKQIEEDLRRVVDGMIDKSEAEITWRSEQAVRNYDPCISCATHFLKLHLERS